MSKKDSVRGSAFGPVANLLSKFQIRLDNFSNQATAMQRELSSARSQYALVVQKSAEIMEGIEDVRSKVYDAHRMSQDALLDVEKQKGTNKEFTESLYKLRDSVQKSFDGVRQDVAALLASQQRLNERIGKVESGLADISTFANSAHSRLDKLESYGVATIELGKINSLEQRLSVVENIVRAVKVLTGLVNKV